MTGYFGLLDLGIRGSVGRYVAFHRAKNDQEGVNSILSTALAILCGVSFLVLLMTLGMSLAFFYLFDVPENLVPGTRVALLIVGLNLAVSLPLDTFSATLWAFQRFDVLNGIDIVLVTIRSALTFWLIGQGQGLAALGLITLGCTVTGAAAKGAMSFQLNRALRLSPGHVKRCAVHRLYGYGIWHVLLSLTRMALPKLNPLIIGSQLSVAMVTPFAIATRLMEYATSILVSSTGVLTPVATAFHAEEKHSQQKKLFLLGGKFCLTLALFFCILFLCVGKPFLLLWMGPAFGSSAVLLAILAVGEILPLSQWATMSMILGIGRHKILALMSLIEDVAGVTLALLLLKPLGLPGVCLGVVLPGAIFRGLGPLIFGCRLMQLSAWEYTRFALLPPLSAAILPGLAFAILVRWRVPATWSELILETGLFVAAYAAATVLLLVGYGRLRSGVIHLSRSLLGVRQESETVCQ